MRTIVRSEKFAETDCIYWEESFYLIQLRLRGLSMTPLTPMHRSSKQKINKETQVLNDTLDEIDLIDIFRTFHPNAEEYTFLSTAHRTFSRIWHIVCHKSNISKFKKIKNLSSIFSDHNAMRLDINCRWGGSVKNTNTWD